MKGSEKMNTGIFSNESAQDTIEYVAMGMIAVLVGVAVLGILQPLLTSKTEAIGEAWPGG